MEYAEGQQNVAADAVGRLGYEEYDMKTGENCRTEHEKLSEIFSPWSSVHVKSEQEDWSEEKFRQTQLEDVSINIVHIQLSSHRNYGDMSDFQSKEVRTLMK